MRLLAIVIALVLGGCAAQEKTTLVQSPTQTAGAVPVSVARTTFFRPVEEPECYSTDERASHFVELTLGEEGFAIQYFHRDRETREWTGNLGVWGISTSVRLGRHERMRTGRIQQVAYRTLTVRWSGGSTSSVDFPTERALGEFLGRIVGPRGVLEQELGRTTVIAYAHSCRRAR